MRETAAAVGGKLVGGGWTDLEDGVTPTILPARRNRLSLSAWRFGVFFCPSSF